MPPGLRTSIFWIAVILDGASMISIAAIGLALDMTPDTGVLGPWVRWIQDNATALIVGFGVSLAISRFVRWLVREKSWQSVQLDRIVSKRLDSFREKCFNELTNEPNDENRVTIFKRVHWKWRIKPWRSPLWPWGWMRWPGSGWLFVIQRSGFATQFSGTVFLAPDDASHAEGIAGMAWRRNGAVRVQPLPDLTNVRYVGLLEAAWIRFTALVGWQRPGNVNQEYAESLRLVKEYAKAAATPERWVWKRIKSGKPHPRSIVAIPLESVDNERWGAIVIDSANDLVCINTDDQTFRQNFNALKTCLDQCGLTR